MRKMNKKGFTIIELAIVIAVIAILAAVLVPAFSGIIRKAHESSALQIAAALYKEAYAIDLSDGEIDGTENGTPITTVSGKPINYALNEHEKTTMTYIAENGYTAVFDGDDWTVSKETNS